MSKKIKVKKTNKEIEILNRNGQIRVTLDSLLNKATKDVYEDVNHFITFYKNTVTIYITSEYTLEKFINFSLLKKISNKLKTDLINLESETRTSNCDTCSLGAIYRLNIVITL